MRSYSCLRFVIVIRAARGFALHRCSVVLSVLRVLHLIHIVEAAFGKNGLGNGSDIGRSGGGVIRCNPRDDRRKAAHLRRLCGLVETQHVFGDAGPLVRVAA